MKLRVGILGGTFCPIHFGHLRMGIEVAEQTGLNRIMLMPNNVPPHKEAPSVSAQDRLMMCRLAAQTCPLFTVSDLEISRGKLSYTINTVMELTQQNPHCDFSFITGADSLINSVWYKFDEILSRLEYFYVLNRPGVTFDELRYKLEQMSLQNAEKIIWVDSPGLEISSTQIRELLASGRSAQYLVPECVLEYIKVRRLFKQQ